MNERDETLLEWIKEEAELVLEMTESDNIESFLSNKHLQHGICMALINIGESVKSLSEELKQENQGIVMYY